MDLLTNEFAVSKIIIALFLPYGKGTPIHKNRLSHGLAFNVGYDSTYRFETGKVLTCHAGEMIYLPKGSSYTVEKSVRTAEEENGGVYVINFLLCNDQKKGEPCTVRIKGTETVVSLFSKAANAWRKEKIGYYEECMSSLYGIVKLLKTEYSIYTPLKKNYESLAPALDYISDHYSVETISIAHLARLCKISEPYLRRLFQQTFSVSPAVYIRNLRIKRAKELLLAGEYSITEAATLSGFNNASYFSREFKKATGISPNEFK